MIGYQRLYHPPSAWIRRDRLGLLQGDGGGSCTFSVLTEWFVLFVCYLPSLCTLNNLVVFILLLVSAHFLLNTMCQFWISTCFPATTHLSYGALETLSLLLHLSLDNFHPHFHQSRSFISLCGRAAFCTLFVALLQFSSTFCTPCPNVIAIHFRFPIPRFSSVTLYHSTPARLRRGGFTHAIDVIGSPRLQCPQLFQ